jgi:hypothetical protein
VVPTKWAARNERIESGSTSIRVSKRTLELLRAWQVATGSSRGLDEFLYFRALEEMEQREEMEFRQ